MFKLARLELRWLTRLSRSALIRGIRAAMRREGLVEVGDIGGDRIAGRTGWRLTLIASSMRASLRKRANWHAAPPKASSAATHLASRQ